MATMRKFNFKKTAGATCAAAVIGLSCGITAFAAPAESTDTTTAPVISEAEETEITSSTVNKRTTTTTAADEAAESSVQTVTEVSGEEAATSQTAEVTTAVTTQAVETELENPYSSGMLADDDFYQSVLDYLADGVNLDLSGTAILVDESTVNADNQTDSESSGDDTADSSEKLMYTVVSRDGSTFYIIIDKGGNGENVYFLNKVDIIDLASLINSEDENLSSQEKAILNEANMSVGTEDDEESEDNDNSSAVSSNNSSNSSSTATTSTSTKKDDTMLYLIVGVAALAAVGIGWYFKIGPGKKNKASFDESDEEDDEEEEYYEEEESEESDDEDVSEEAYEEE